MLANSTAYEGSLMGSHSRARKRICHQVSAVPSNISSSLLPKIPESCIPISGPSQELVIPGHSVRHRGETSKWGRQGQVSIDILPGEVLLEIFEILMVSRGPFTVTHRSRILMHVCRRWRCVVLGSTHRLNLQLLCTYTTPVRKMLDIWPALPIIIERNGGSRLKGADNIVAALEHPDRVRRITLLGIRKSDLKRFAAAMTDPFPALTHLKLRPVTKRVSVLPDSFLGGSAPRLQEVELSGIPFPAMPKLLSSASDLVSLYLWDIPHSGYISPEAMVTGLSALTRLNTLLIQFQSPLSRPDEPSPPPSIRTVLPALKVLMFRGVSEYLEDLISRIDAPLLSHLDISFFNQLIFNTPRLSDFINHTKGLRSRSQACIKISRGAVELSTGYTGLTLMILCKASDWQLSSLTQFCDSPFPLPFNFEYLDICEHSSSRPHWQEDVEHSQWLELLRPFTTVKQLTLCKKFAPRVVPALQELSGDEMMNVLPALQRIVLRNTSLASLSDPAKESFAQFVTARQLSGHPVAVK